MIKQSAIEKFLDDLASQNATPGGGSAAAIMGAMGAALVAMVCNLTIGKKKYADVEDEMRALLAKAEALRHKLTGMIEDDVKASAVAVATLLYQLAMRDEMLPRFPAAEMPAPVPAR